MRVVRALTRARTCDARNASDPTEHVAVNADMVTRRESAGVGLCALGRASCCDALSILSGHHVAKTLNPDCEVHFLRRGGTHGRARRWGAVPRRARDPAVIAGTGACSWSRRTRRGCPRTGRGSPGAGGWLGRAHRAGRGRIRGANVVVLLEPPGTGGPKRRGTGHGGCVATRESGPNAGVGAVRVIAVTRRRGLPHRGRRQAAGRKRRTVFEGTGRTLHEEDARCIVGF